MEGTVRHCPDCFAELEFIEHYEDYPGPDGEHCQDLIFEGYYCEECDELFDSKYLNSLIEVEDE